MAKKIVRLLKVSFLILFLSCGLIGKFSFIGYSWPRSIVKKAIRTTSVFFVAYPKGTILGTGVIIDKEGRTLTAAHLFTHGDYSHIKMVTADTIEHDMVILSINRRVDLALVQPIVSAQSFPYSKIDKSDDLYIGQDVLVVGHSHGDFWTVTSGIISRLTWSFWYLAEIIETDAIVNPGNSGGPMFNTKGQVIGIISAMKINIFGKTGIGIAIPAHEIRKFLDNHKLHEQEPKQVKRYRIGDIK